MRMLFDISIKSIAWIAFNFIDFNFRSNAIETFKITNPVILRMKSIFFPFLSFFYLILYNKTFFSSGFHKGSVILKKPNQWNLFEHMQDHILNKHCDFIRYWWDVKINEVFLSEIRMRLFASLKWFRTQEIISVLARAFRFWQLQGSQKVLNSRCQLLTYLTQVTSPFRVTMD